MDWCFDPAAGGSRQALEADIAAYLARHVGGEDAVEEATVRVRDTLEGLASGARQWVHIGWERGEARLEVRRLAGPVEELPGVSLARGVTACPAQRAELTAAALPGGRRRVRLGARATAEEDLDVDPGGVELPAEREGFLVGLAVLGTGLAGYSPQGCAALGGAAAARRAEADYRAAHGIDGPLAATQLAEAFVDYQESIGGDFTVEEADDDRAVVANHRCPFGDVVEGAPHLCRITSATLGSMAARSCGEASVHLDERIAAGDPHCRLTLELGSGPHPASAHCYTDPPKGFPPAVSLGDRETVAGEGMSLSLQLPRDSLSVGVIRHMARHALTEVGVTENITCDVELALSEACSNVLEHAGAGDAYEVGISVRADRCDLRVVDTGRGFDYRTVQEHDVGLEEERGRGLRLMRALMDRVNLESTPERGTLVNLTKQLAFDEDAPGRVLLTEAARQRHEQAERTT